jgi:hypothetical protein
MTTRNLVPRSANEGQLGTDLKPWQEVNVNKVYASNNVLVFNNVEEMKSSNKVKSGYTIKTLGFYEANDGGGADYVITNDIGEDEADEASIIALQKGLYAKLLIKDYINIKWFGAKGDDETDDTEAIQKAVTYINKNAGTLFFTDGNYIISNTGNNIFEITSSNVSITGTANSFIKYKGVGESGYIFHVLGTKDTYLENISIYGLNIDGYGQEFKGGNTSETKTETHPNPYAKGLTAIRFSFVKNMSVEKCSLKEIYGEGIIGRYSYHANILDNIVENCSAGNIVAGGITGYDDHGDGIAVFGSYSVRIKGNSVTNNRKYKVHFSKDDALHDVYDCICGRSGLEYEYATNTDGINAPNNVENLNDDLSGTCLILDGNFVKGYTKGTHLESNVNVDVINNTFVGNYIDIMCSTQYTNISGNRFNRTTVETAPQYGYDQYSRGGVAISEYGTKPKNIIITNNYFNKSSITLANNNVIISNNIFKMDNDISDISIVSKNSGSENININNNVFLEGNNNKACCYISLFAPINASIDGNTFDMQDKEKYAIYIYNGTHSIKLINNIFKTNSISKVLTKYENSISKDIFLIGNRVYGNSNKCVLLEVYDPWDGTILNNIMENREGIFFYNTGTNRGVWNINNNFGSLKTTGYAPNVEVNSSVTSIRENYIMLGTLIRSLAGNATNGATGKKCTKAGFLTALTWTSGTKYTASNTTYANSANNVYCCTNAGSGNSTIEPTHTEGTVTESDGYTWEYIGVKAELENF